MVAKQTKSRRTSPRKPKADPIERARAEVTKAALAATPQDAAGIEFEALPDIARLERAEWDSLCAAHAEAVTTAFALLSKSKPELVAMWQGDEVMTGNASYLERTRDWLASTAGVVDEALARLLVAGAVRAEAEARAA